MTNLHITHIASEFAPLAKVGGLADVASGLTRQLSVLGDTVSMILPAYSFIERDRIKNLRLWKENFSAQSRISTYQARVWKGEYAGIHLYLVEPYDPVEPFASPHIYGEDNDTERFLVFSFLAAELVKELKPKQDIVHLHDWQTALIAQLLKDHPAKTVFTIHNIQYQGYSSKEEVSEYLPSSIKLASDSKNVNLLQEAIEASDFITTVSPSYAEEVKSHPGGKGLEEVIKKHQARFKGILNGIDYNTWNPSADESLSNPFTFESPYPSKKNQKRQFQKELGLDQSELPIISCVTRLTEQKGLEMIEHVLNRTLEKKWQFVLLGSAPEKGIQEHFLKLQNQYKNHPDIRLCLTFNETLSRKVYASSDMLIVPSLFEPCGLTQMISLRYGTVPIVRNTGGLSDSILDIEHGGVPFEEGNGFSFDHPDTEGIDWAVNRAVQLYQENPSRWQQLVKQGMLCDFSWKKSAESYREVYSQII